MKIDAHIDTSIETNYATEKFKQFDMKPYVSIAKSIAASKIENLTRVLQ